MAKFTITLTDVADDLFRVEGVAEPEMYEGDEMTAAQSMGMKVVRYLAKRFGVAKFEDSEFRQAERDG